MAGLLDSEASATSSCIVAAACASRVACVCNEAVRTGLWRPKPPHSGLRLTFEEIWMFRDFEPRLNSRTAICAPREAAIVRDGRTKRRTKRRKDESVGRSSPNEHLGKRKTSLTTLGDRFHVSSVGEMWTAVLRGGDGEF